MVNNKISANIVDGLEQKITDATVDKVVIGYDKNRDIVCNGATTVKLQDDDEIVSFRIEDNATITFDISELTFPKIYYTAQLFVYFPNGAKTVTLEAPAEKSFAWINGNIPNFSSGKEHLLALRFAQPNNSILMSDGGEVG